MPSKVSRPHFAVETELNAAKLFQLLADRSSDIVWIVCRDGKLLCANSRFVEFIAAPLEKVQSSVWEHIIHPIEQTSFMEEWTKAIEASTAFDGSWLLRTHKDYFGLHIRADPIRDINDLTRYWLCVCETAQIDNSDIAMNRAPPAIQDNPPASTESAIRNAKQGNLSHQADSKLIKEQTITETNTAPLNTKLWHSELFESLDEGMCVIEMAEFDEAGKGVDYRFLETNAAFERHTGLKKAVGRTARDLVPNLERLWPQRYGRIATTGIRECFIDHSIAMNRWFEVDAFPVGPREQKLVGIFFRDVTERIEGVEALRRKEEELRRKNAQLGLLARVSQIAIQSNLTERELLSTAFKEVSESIGAEMYFNYTPHDSTSMRLCTWTGLTQNELSLFETMRYGEQLCGRVALQRRSIVIEDIAHTDVEGSEAVHAAGYGAYAGFPLLAEDRLLGTVAFITRHKNHFDAGEIQTIQTICDQVAATLERLRLTRELGENEERQRLALEAAGLGTWDLDLTTGHTVWNDRQSELLGYGTGYATPSLKRWLDVVHPEDAQTAMEQIEKAKLDHEPVSIEHRILRNDTHELRWVSLYGRFSYDRDQHAVRLRGVSQDITDRKNFEVDLIRSQQRLDLGTRVGGLTLVEVDYSSGCCSLTAQASKLFGLGTEPCNVPRETVHATFHPEDREHLMQEISACMDPRGDGWFAMDHRIVRPSDGNIAWIRVRKQVFFEGEGLERKAVRAMLAALDVTVERSGAEAIRQSEAFIRSVLDALPENVAVLDSNGIIVAVNEPWQNFAFANGGTKDAASPIGVRYLDLFQSQSLCEDVHAKEAFLHLTELLDGKRDSFTLEYACSTPDRPRWYLMNGRRIDSKAHVLISHLDITERKQAEDRLQFIADRAGVGQWYWDIAQNRLEWSPLCKKLFGLVPDEPLDYERFLKTLHPDERQRVDALINDCLAGRSSPSELDIEFRVLHPDGTLRYIHSKGSATFQNGQPLRMAGISLDVTDRVLAQNAVQSHHELLSTIFDHMPAAINIIRGSDMRLIMANPGYHTLSLGTGEPVGQTLDEIWEDVGHDFSTLCRKVLDTGEPHHSTDELVRTRPSQDAEAEDRWFTWSLVRISLPNNQGWGIFNPAWETTERMRAEQALRHSEARYRSLFENMSDGFILAEMIWNDAGSPVDFRCLEVNKAFEQCGISAGSATGKTIRELVPDIEPELIEKFAQVVAAGESISYESFVSGLGKWLETFAFKHSENCFGVTLRDVSERKYAEERLRVARSRLETALVASRVTLFHHDRELRYTWIHNPQPGFSEDGIIGKSDHEIMELGSDAIKIEAIKRSVLETGVANQVEVGIEQAGKLHFFDLFVQPDVDASGNTIGINCAAVDITQRKEIEEKLRESDRRKDEFLATLSHELRNPLATIRSGIEVLTLVCHEVSDAAQPLEMMQRQVRHLVALIDDLLEVSRISRGKIRLRKERVPLAESMKAAIETYRAQIGDAGHELILNLPPQAIYVEGDPHRLLQIFANLLNNAVKYSPSPGQIAISMKETEGHVIVAIKDSGIGIERNQLTHVFDLFAQIETQSTGYAGLGVGLALVKSLVELHHGAIWAESDGLGHGATFTLKLPLSVQGEFEPTSEPIENPTATVKKSCVLVVDDNSDAASLLALLVRNFGHEVITASNGLEAIKYCEEFRPDLALLDIGMPVMDGYQAAKAIREKSWGQNVLLVALTGWGQEDDVQKSKDAGFDLHLVKPVDLASIQKLLEEVRRGD